MKEWHLLNTLVNKKLNAAETCDLITLVVFNRSCEGVAGHTQCGLGRTRRLCFDKTDPPELCPKNTEKPNGKLLSPLNALPQ